MVRHIEIESAANFLSNLLKLHSAILSPEQLERFKDAIESHLEEHYQQHWFPEQPNKGSAYRCIRINQKMDPIIAKAGCSVGLDHKALRTIFPGELTLWIDPKEVSYRIGENGSICVLYEGAKDEIKAPTLANKANTVKSQQQHNKQTNNQQSEVSRASPTDSSLSSTTSTMSSPSPSSSPDWCRPAGNTGNERRSSPISAFPGNHVGHNFHGQNGDLGLMNSQQASAYAFNHGVVNARNGHSGFGPNHYQSSTWSSPSRVESPNNWHYSGRRHHHGSSPHHQQHHNNHGGQHPQSGHHQNAAYNGWNESVANNGFGQYDHQRNHNHHGGHLTAHSGHMSLNANVEQMAAYVSS